MNDIKLMNNQRIVVLNYTPDHRNMVEEVHNTSKVLTEKEFKKWYNHIWKQVVNNDTVDTANVLAVYEDEQGETCELANWWGIQEMQYDPKF